MQEFPCTAFLSEDLRDSQSSLSRVLLAAQTHFFLALNRHGEAQVSTDSSVKVCKPSSWHSSYFCGTAEGAFFSIRGSA